MMNNIFVQILDRILVCCPGIIFYRGGHLKESAVKEGNPGPVSTAQYNTISKKN